MEVKCQRGAENLQFAEFSSVDLDDGNGKTVPVNPVVGYSCGAAVEGSPRRQPWVAVLAIGAAKRRKEILFGPNSVAP